uniref:Uncharacterized protein n=1 Tax=Romanomermis culicivorax TaxID=13658 RepID=A0A915IN39_ROMCU
MYDHYCDRFSQLNLSFVTRARLSLTGIARFPDHTTKMQEAYPYYIERRCLVFVASGISNYTDYKHVESTVALSDPGPRRTLCTSVHYL